MTVLDKHTPVIYVGNGKEYKCFRCRGIGVDLALDTWCLDCGGSGRIKTDSAIVCKACDYHMPITRYNKGSMSDDAMGFNSYPMIAIFKCPSCSLEWHY